MDLSNSVSLVFNPPLPDRDALFKKTGIVDTSLFGYSIYADSKMVKVTAPNKVVLVDRPSRATPFTNLQLALENIKNHDPTLFKEGKVVWVNSLEKEVVQVKKLDELLLPYLYKDPIPVPN